MNIFARLARNSLWLLMARIGAQICAVLVTSLLARRLSVAEFGEYSFMAAVILVGNVLTTFGSDMVLIREIAADSRLSSLSPALILQLTLSILFIMLVFWASPYLPNQTSASILALRIYSFALIPLAFFTIFTSVLRGAQKMSSYAWLNLLLALFQVALIWALIQRSAGIVLLAYSLLSVQTAGTILAGFLCRGHFPDFWKAWSFSWFETTELFRVCLPIAVIATLGIVYQKLNVTMLSLLGSPAMTGWFSAAARVVEVARMGHVAAFTALYPAMANSWENKSEAGVFKFSWSILLIIAMIESVGLFLLAQPLVIFFFGLNYQAAVPILRILVLTLIPYTVNSYLSLSLLVEHREKMLIWILSISLILLLLLNLWMIPRFGEVGVSWSFLLTEGVQAGLLLFEWRRKQAPSREIIFSDTGASHELSDLS